MIGAVFVGTWVFLFVSYTAFNLFLQKAFYHVPLFSTRSKAPDHHRVVFTNLAIASSFAGTVAQLCSLGRSRLTFEPIDFTAAASIGTSIGTIVAWTAVASVYEGVLEYYWHRTMHRPYFYARLHKIHHFHKNPEPFDDLYVHPLEVSGYYCILYSPAFVFGMPVESYWLYMIYMGLTGVLDHSGVQFELPAVYNPNDHAVHHKKFEVNYGFPHPFMDILHGTFEGKFCGIRFTAKRVRPVQDTRPPSDTGAIALIEPLATPTSPGTPSAKAAAAS